jgi:hypothetical protein
VPSHSLPLSTDPLTVEDRVAAVCARYDGEDDEAARLAEAALRRLDWRRRRGGKECSRCGAVLPVSAFGPDLRRPDGLRYVCRPCEAADRRRRRERVV